MKRGATVVDPTALVVDRPSDYARAHLPEYDYIAYGKNNYVLLREAALELSSYAYHVNGADFEGGDASRANVKYVIVRDEQGGGTQLGLRLTADVRAGEELLAAYTTPL